MGPKCDSKSEEKVIHFEKMKLKLIPWVSEINWTMDFPFFSELVQSLQNLFRGFDRHASPDF